MMNFLKDLQNNPMPMCKLNPTEFKQCPQVNRYRIPVSGCSSVLTDWEISQLNPIRLISKDIKKLDTTNSWIPKTKTDKRMVDILCGYFFFIKNPLGCMPYFPISGITFYGQVCLVISLPQAEYNTNHEKSNLLKVHKS
uniref:Uncharacterized protein n=1 Tax=Micrurus paraensis TaxID=1970185 RepID=A0A2D4K7A2_9SAUR